MNDDFEVYRCTVNGHFKQWGVRVYGSTLITRYGKIGGTQQQTLKVCPTPRDAHNAKRRLIEEKLGKGYARFGLTAMAPPAVNKPVSMAPVAHPVHVRRRMLDLG